MFIRTNRMPRRSDERGASLVEYALLVALIAVVCIAAVIFLGRSGSNKLQGAGDAIGGADNCVELPPDMHYYANTTGQTVQYLPGPCP